MRPLLFLSALLLLTSCKEDTKKPVPECLYTCSDAPMGIQIDAAAYTPEELDTIILRSYEADNMFTTVQDEWIVVINDTGQYTERNPIVFEKVYAGTDYEILIPGTQQTYHIYDVVKPETKTHTFKGDGCGAGHFTCEVNTRECTVSGGNYSLDHTGRTTVILKH